MTLPSPRRAFPAGEDDRFDLGGLVGLKAGEPRMRAAVMSGVAVLVLALGGAGAAQADVFSPADFAPSVWSDQADYMPGQHVVLTSAGWAPGESVHVVVNDDEGSTWKREVDLTADDN